MWPKWLHFIGTCCCCCGYYFFLSRSDHFYVNLNSFSSHWTIFSSSFVWVWMRIGAAVTTTTGVWAVAVFWSLIACSMFDTQYISLVALEQRQSSNNKFKSWLLLVNYNVLDYYVYLLFKWWDMPICHAPPRKNQQHTHTLTLVNKQHHIDRYRKPIENPWKQK